jgi:heme exporter protein A
MLRAQGISCQRGERALFTGLDLHVGAGEWLHVRGENGVGKTSLLRILAGLSQATAGDILWDQRSILKDSESYRQNLLFLGHKEAVKEDLTAYENLQLSAALDHIDLTEEDALSALRRFGLRGREDLPVRFLSAGQKRRVLLARLLTRKAKLWILDEPFNALDVKAVEMLSGLIAEHVGAGGMVIMTSHQAISIPHGKVLEL